MQESPIVDKETIEKIFNGNLRKPSSFGRK